MKPSALRAVARRAGRRFDSLPAPVRGAFWMILGCAGFACMNLIVRRLVTELHAFEVVFLRNVMSLAFMLPWLVRVGLRGISNDHQLMYFSRASTGFVSMTLWFWAIALIPLAEATALSFTSPLFATVSAVLVLGEIVRARRWTATAIGFLGVLVVLRPGMSEIGWAQIMVLASSAIGGFNAVLVKQLSSRDSPSMIVTLQMLWVTPMSLVLALFVWRAPSLAAWGWAVVLGLTATLSHQAVTRAYAATEASALAPYDFMRLPIVAFAAWGIYGEIPDGWTWLGAAVIFSSSMYIAYREGRIARDLARKAEPVGPAAANETGRADVSAPRAPPRPPRPP